MKMQPVDTMGSLYSSAGLRFGGFRTSQFIELTEDLEELRPGVREEIVAEAHYLAFWLHRFPEIAFFFGTLVSRSLLVGFLCFVGAFLLEIFRFYTFGASPLLSHLHRLWNWIKWPLFIGASLLLWPEGRLIPLVFMIFLILQGWAGLISTLGMLPIKLAILTLLYRLSGKKRPRIFNMEGHAMQYVIDRWRMKLLPPKEALKFYQASKEDIEFYELSSEESFMKAYKNKPFLNAIVSCFWLLTVGGVVMIVYSLFTRNLLGITIGFLLTAISLMIWYILHNWALKHPKQ